MIPKQWDFPNARCLPVTRCALQHRRIPRLDPKLYISNLWYLNFSDRTACRLTGMTRFASFWVEGGRIVAPVDVMRFDDSVFRLLGQELVGLTSERELLVNSDSYHQRNANSMRLPGAVVREMAFTL